MRRTLSLAAAAIALAPNTAAMAAEGASGPALVSMKEIVVPIVDGARAYGRLHVKIVLLAHDPAAVGPIEARMPQLREAALIAAAEFARFYASPFAPVDAARLAKDVGAAVSTQDKDHTITRVLLVGVFAEQS